MPATVPLTTGSVAVAMLLSMHGQRRLRIPKDSWLLHGGAVRRRLVLAAWPGLADLASGVDRTIPVPRRRPALVPVSARPKG
jgi:hypothetical protein